VTLPATHLAPPAAVFGLLELLFCLGPAGGGLCDHSTAGRLLLAAATSLAVETNSLLLLYLQDLNNTA
jgi:hypothetical protein